MFSENYEHLVKEISSNDSITFYNKNSRVIPINTKSNADVFKFGSLKIIGELSRIMTKKSLVNYNFHYIDENDEFNGVNIDSSDIYYFNKLLDDYLNKEGLHPKFLLQIPLSDDDEMRRSEQSIAEFLHDIIFKDIESFVSFYQCTEDFNSNLLINYILENLDEQNYTPRNMKEYFAPNPLSSVIEVIKEDFMFALDNPIFLLDNFEQMISYYLFFYFVQFILKTFTSNSTKIEETYYLVDWETASNGRNSINLGWSRIKGPLINLKSKIDVIEQLNILLGEQKLLVPEIIALYNEMDEKSKIEFKYYVKLWITRVRFLENLEKVEFSDDISELIKTLEKSIQEAYIVNKAKRSGTTNRYTQTVKTLGEKYFLKRRGQYGYMFNITLDLLLLITKLCINNKKRIQVDELFNEYERRGLFFDYDSRLIIISKFEQLNLIDKKSDSGEVQYVRFFS